MQASLSFAKTDQLFVSLNLIASNRQILFEMVVGRNYSLLLELSYQHGKISLLKLMVKGLNTFQRESFSIKGRLYEHSLGCVFPVALSKFLAVIIVPLAYTG